MAHTVLICDDAIFMRTMVADILQQAGYEVVGEAETGKDAVEKYKMLRPDLVALSATKRFDTTYVAHIDERMPHRRGLHSLSARSPVEQMLRTIVQSEFVISTSLHAVIVAEAFGVPARTIVNQTEPEFKYLDHFHATGRPDIVRATSIDDALHLVLADPLHLAQREADPLS